MVYCLLPQYNVGKQCRFNVLTVLEGPGSEIKSLSFSSSSLTLAVGARDKSVWVWGVVMSSLGGGGVVPGDDDYAWECLSVLDGSRGDVKVVGFLPPPPGGGAERILSAGYDEVVRVWGRDDDAADHAGDPVDDDDDKAGYYQLDVSPPSSSGGGGEHHARKTGGIPPDRGMRGQGATVWDLAVTPSGGRIFAGGGRSPDDDVEDDADDAEDADAADAKGDDIGDDGGGRDGGRTGGDICIWESRFSSSSSSSSSRRQRRRQRSYWVPVGRLGSPHGGAEVYSLDVAGVASARSKTSRRRG